MTEHANHSKELARIKKIAGQINGIQKMVDDGRYCIDILTQVKAAKSALTSLESVILENHLKHCLNKAAQTGDSKIIEEKVSEVCELFKKSSR